MSPANDWSYGLSWAHTSFHKAGISSAADSAGLGISSNEDERGLSLLHKSAQLVLLMTRDSHIGRKVSAVREESVLERVLTS